MTHTYELDETKYTPHGINVIAVCKLGHKFGAVEYMFDSDEDGTWIKTSANYLIFTRDHGKFSRTIRHARSCLPELNVNASNSTFKSYCTKLKRIYNDAISFAFVTDTVDVEDDLSETTVNNGRDFEVGDSVK
jgi:hypothetical protein